MQPLTAEGARLLTAPDVTVSAGVELLTPALGFAADLSADLQGGEVKRAMLADVHGTCTLLLTRELVWGVDLVRPYMVLSDEKGSERWNLGVYALTTPQSVVAEEPRTFQVDGFDRTYLLRREVGMDYSVAAGTTYRQALLDTFAAAGLGSGVLIEGSAADNVLPVTRLWPLVASSPDPDQTDTPVTWLRVVNDLLRAINFQAVWADQDGVFRCGLYRPPSSRPVEYTFNADTGTIVGEQRTITGDRFASPNRWVFLQSNRPDGAPAPTEGDGIYTVNLPADDPLSAQQRGLVWNRVVKYEAASQAALVALGDRRVAGDRAVTTTFNVTTGPFPPAGHYDVFTYADTQALGTVRVQAVEWTMPLDGGDVTWTWERVT